MYCKKCGGDVKNGWSFCPNCGYQIKKLGISFSDIFERLGRQFGLLDDTFSKGLETVNMKPILEHRKIRGYAITMNFNSNGEPQINVKTYGNPNSEELSKKLNSGFIPRFEPRISKEPDKKTEKKLIVPEKIEEPKTKVRRLRNRIEAEIHLPGVKSDKDVNVKELTESVEVQARVGNKTLFKILNIPKNFSIINQKFDNEKLLLEFSN